jgi:hypothetical protein
MYVYVLTEWSFLFAESKFWSACHSNDLVTRIFIIEYQEKRGRPPQHLSTRDEEHKNFIIDINISNFMKVCVN